MRIEPPGLNYQPVWLALGWLMVAVVVWLSLWPSPPKGPDFPDSDKLLHGLTYLVLTGWFGQLYPSSRGRAAAVLGFAALGAGLEVLQGWVASGRRRGWMGSPTSAECLAGGCACAPGWR